jgi:hypothetical protein
VGVGGNLLDSGSRSGADEGGVGTGTLLGLGIKSRGICGVGVGEGALNGDTEGEGDDDGDALGWAFCAREIIPVPHKTKTSRKCEMRSPDWGGKREGNAGSAITGKSNQEELTLFRNPLSAIRIFCHIH